MTAATKNHRRKLAGKSFYSREESFGHSQKVYFLSGIAPTLQDIQVHSATILHLVLVQHGYFDRDESFRFECRAYASAIAIRPSSTNSRRRRPRPKENCPLRIRWANSMRPRDPQVRRPSTAKSYALRVGVFPPNRRTQRR